MKRVPSAPHRPSSRRRRYRVVGQHRDRPAVKSGQGPLSPSGQSGDPSRRAAGVHHRFDDAPHLVDRGGRAGTASMSHGSLGARSGRRRVRGPQLVYGRRGKTELAGAGEGLRLALPHRLPRRCGYGWRCHKLLLGKVFAEPGHDRRPGDKKLRQLFYHQRVVAGHDPRRAALATSFRAERQRTPAPWPGSAPPTPSRVLRNVGAPLVSAIDRARRRRCPSTKRMSGRRREIAGHLVCHHLLLPRSLHRPPRRAPR